MMMCDFQMPTVKTLRATLPVVGLIAFGLVFSVSPAYAQSIDYATMEDLFGEPVTTSATGKPQRLSEVPLTMEILTQEDIRRSGATTLPEALRQVNGVNVSQQTALRYDVAIRGYNQYNSQRLLVLLNGRQVYLDHYGYTEWNAIPVQLEEIQQIEIVKGPNTALFGFNAVNGVINIVTYNPLYDDKSSVGVRVGTDDYRQGHYVQSLKLNDAFGMRLSAGSFRSDPFDTTLNSAAGLESGSDRAEFDDSKQHAVNIDTLWQVGDKSQLRMELSSTGVAMAQINPLGNMQNVKYQTEAMKLSYETDTDLGLIKANVYKNFMDFNYQASTTDPIAKSDQEVFVAQLEDTVELNNNHTARLQVEYRKNQMDSPDLMEDGAEVAYDLYAASGMWAWQINDRWSWTNAVRVDQLELQHNGVFSSTASFTEKDYDDVSLTEYSYNSGLWWSPTPKDTLRLSTGRGLEIPSLVEFGLDLSPSGVVLSGNPNTETAVVTNYELAWDRKLDLWDDGLLRSAVFYNETDNVKSLFSDINGLTYISDNVGDSSSYGVELELSGVFRQKFDWFLGYIYQVIDDNFDYYGSDKDVSIPYPKEFEDSNPQHQINLKLGYQEGPWEADALVYFVSETTQFALSDALANYPVEQIDPYVGLNVRVGYTFDNDITLAFYGQQLQSSTTQTSTTPDVERRLFISLSKSF